MTEVLELSQEAYDLLDKTCADYDALISEFNEHPEGPDFRRMYAEYTLMRELEKASDYFEYAKVTGVDTVNKYLALPNDRHADLQVATMVEKFEDKDDEAALMEFGFYMAILANEETRNRYVNKWREFMGALMADAREGFGDMTEEQFKEQLGPVELLFHVEMAISELDDLFDEDSGDDEEESPAAE